MQAGFDEFSELRIIPRFNVAPSQAVPIVALKDGRRLIRPASWGFVPVWSQGDQKFKPINAKAETVATSGMFRSAFKAGRCLLPADGFYEWRPGPPKAPFFFRRPDDELFAFAGLSGRDGTCLLLTTSPNSVVAPVHGRMPVLLHPGDYGRWLDPDAATDELQGLLRPYPDNELIGSTVGTK
jgi:putative SOS response-associated peptidase YedK